MKARGYAIKSECGYCRFGNGCVDRTSDLLNATIFRTKHEAKHWLPTGCEIIHVSIEEARHARRQRTSARKH
jgi:hypothetical protein